MCTSILSLMSNVYDVTRKWYQFDVSQSHSGKLYLPGNILLYNLKYWYKSVLNKDVKVHDLIAVTLSLLNQHVILHPVGVMLCNLIGTRNLGRQVSWVPLFSVDLCKIMEITLLNILQIGLRIFFSQR